MPIATIAVVFLSPEPPDLPGVAGYYSQLAGVLAGFSFAGLVALATIPRAAGRSQDATLHSVAPLTSAFIGLVASSLNYALVAGETAGTARVAALQTIAGLGFGVAGNMLLYSILVLLCDLRSVAGAGIHLLKNLLVIILPPLLTVLMWSGVRDHLQQKYGRNIGFRTPDWIALGALSVTVSAAIIFRARYSARPSLQSKNTLRLATVAAWLAFLSLAGSATFITLTLSDSDVPDILPVSALLVVATFSSAVGYSASRHRSWRLEDSGWRKLPAPLLGPTRTRRIAGTRRRGLKGASERSESTNPR